MATENDFLAFAVGGSANVVTQAVYAANATLLANGYQSGLANSNLLNKTWRQASIISAMVAQFIVDQSGQPAIDDGTIATLETNFITAIKAAAGAVVFAGGVVTGTVNALVVAATTPSGFSLQNNFSVTLTPTALNTGPATVNVSSTGVIAIEKLSGGSLIALAGGELAIGDPVTITYNGSVWVLNTTPLGALAFLGFGYGLGPDGGGNALVSNYALSPTTFPTNLAGSAAGGTQTASWSVSGEIVAAVSLGGKKYLGYSLSTSTLAFNGATTGAGAMDTGAMPISGDLSVYAIYNPSGPTWATLGTLGTTSNGIVYAGANMPAGYTASRLLWAGKTDSSGNILQFLQVGNRISVASVTVLTSQSASSWTAVPIGGAVPTAAKTVTGNAQTESANGLIYVAPNTSGLGVRYAAGESSAAADGNFTDLACPLVTGVPNIAYKMNGIGAGDLAITEYTIQ